MIGRVDAPKKNRYFVLEKQSQWNIEKNTILWVW